MCTIASDRTDTSADAIIPRTFTSSIVHSAEPRRRRHSMPFPDEEEWVEGEAQADESDYEDDLLDIYFSGMCDMHPCLTNLLNCRCRCDNTGISEQS